MRIRRTLSRDDGAIAQPFAFLTAGAIFVAAVAGLLAVSRSASIDHQAADQAGQDIQAGSVADLLVGSPGVGWAAGADHLSRLGLQASNGSGLSPSSLDALRGAQATSQSNGKVDYPDALASLGLPTDGTAGFHIRVYPVGLEELYGQTLSGLRVGYIGDWTSLASVSIAASTAPSDIAAQVNVQVNLTQAANTYQEREAIKALGVHFQNRVYAALATPSVSLTTTTTVLGVTTTTSTPLPSIYLPLLDGDVYPDIKTYLDTVLAGRLSNYDVLVVGSGVDHSTLVTAATKNGIRDWVLAGGTLLVMGSDDKSTNWLNPLFTAGVSNVNGAPTAPDATHPLLSDPNNLAWTSYSSFGQAWDLASAGTTVYSEFSHVVLQGGSDVLAVSNQASFGSGSILLTTWRGRDIASSLGVLETEHFLENCFVYSAGRSALYLDYGGTVPADLPVSLAVRQSYLYDSVLGQVPVRVEVLTWGG